MGENLNDLLKQKAELMDKQDRIAQYLGRDILNGIHPKHAQVYFETRMRAWLKEYTAIQIKITNLAIEATLIQDTVMVNSAKAGC